MYLKTALIFISLTIFFGFKPTFAMDMEMVRTIADKLENLTDSDIKIVAEESAKPDAYLHPMGHIVITTGLMHLLKDDAEMAFVIGHEMAHLIKGHYDREEEDILGISKEISASDKIKKERDADEYSLILLKRAGYERGASLKVLSGLCQMMDKNSAGYSSIQQRMNALRKIWN